ncbi:hypothetical protein [Cellulomonas sp. C5510]|nr:hypothetical protein [Cellulomonas sp. C5510]
MTSPPKADPSPHALTATSTRSTDDVPPRTTTDDRTDPDTV